jgi:hypothetical protein
MMPQKGVDMAKKSTAEIVDETSAIGAVAMAISSVGDEFESIKFKIEDMTDAINNTGIDTSIRDLAEVIALQTIATNGSDEDREEAVEKLKRTYLRD